MVLVLSRKGLAALLRTCGCFPASLVKCSTGLDSSFRALSWLAGPPLSCRVPCRARPSFTYQERVSSSTPPVVVFVFRYIHLLLLPCSLRHLVLHIFTTFTASSSSSFAQSESQFSRASFLSCLVPHTITTGSLTVFMQ